MSLDAALARIGAIEQMMSGAPTQASTTAASPAAGAATTTPTTSLSPSSAASFAQALEQADVASALAPSEGTGATDGLAASDGTDATAGLDTGTQQPLSELTSLLTSGAAPAATTALGTSGATQLSGAASLGTSALTPTTALGQESGGGNRAMVTIARSQVGQSEQPPGSNDGPAVAMYRGATAGAMPGEPWCAYFASWVARQAGTPLGPTGQGFGSVSDIWSWAQQTGRAVSNGPGVVPQPGDLIVFGSEHVGIVTGVQSNGDIDTVEGNYSNRVSANVRSPTEATGYVRMS